MTGERESSSPEALNAFILDLDGVVTDTASVHARAWKRAFDAFLQARAERTGGAFVPFDVEADYRRFVDGKPRYDGVRSFLDARGIELPEGDAGDAPDRETIHGLGNRKNELFLEMLGERGVEAYEDAVLAVKRWKRAGRKLGVVTSSKNAAAVLEAAGLDGLFDARVDGVTLDELDLPGKPAPDAFLEAARRLGVSPEKSAVFEDAASGVKAGRDGGFALVVGLDRSGEAAKDLREQGADRVIESFEELEPRRLLSKSECLEELGRRLDAKRLALFLDYDGTLTPIVERPESAELDETMRDVLDQLSKRLPVAVVSGRDLRDLEERVGLSSVVYAGSHGFDIEGPRGLREVHEGGESCLPSLDGAEEELAKRLEGPRLERKRFALAVHYRGLPEDVVARTEQVVEDVASRLPKLRLTRGKKIFELRPSLDWDKGRAVLWLLDALGLLLETTLPVYVGDDETDEDAFRALAESGLGIRVGRASSETAARGGLESVSEVESFLEGILSFTEAQ